MSLSLQSFLTTILNQGSMALPAILFTHYKKLGLSESDLMALIHIMYFAEREHKALPTIHELHERMKLSKDDVAKTLQFLIKGGFLEIEQFEEDDVRCERYSIKPFLQQLSSSFLDEEQKNRVVDNGEGALFRLFEQEFCRPLSPLECEILSRWTVEDSYPDALIEAALREAVFCGKLNFRYIDRILLEWHKHKIKTADEAAYFSNQYRQKGLLYQGKK